MASNKGILAFSLFLVLAIASLSFASASALEKTAVIGRLYTGNFESDLLEVAVTVICNDISYPATTNKNHFGIMIDSSDCSKGDKIYVVGARKGFSQVNVQATVIKCSSDTDECLVTAKDSSEIDIQYIAIANLDLDPKLSKRSWEPVSDKFNQSKPTVSASLLSAPQVEPISVKPESPVEVNDPVTSNIQEEQTQTAKSPKGLNQITGSYLVGGNGSWITLVVMVLLAALVAYFIFIRGKTSTPDYKDSSSDSNISPVFY